MYLESLPFKDWFAVYSSQNEGLITVNTASKILGVNPDRVTYLWQRKRIQAFMFPGDKTRYLSYKDIKKLTVLFELKRKLMPKMYKHEIGK